VGIVVESDGAGRSQFSNQLHLASSLNEASLEQLMTEIARVIAGRKVSITPTQVAFNRKMAKNWQNHWAHWKLRQRSRNAHLGMARVSREEVEDGLVPSRSVRGWQFYADFAEVDRRRVRRMIRQHYREENPYAN
jgi:hypothetical protein